jgi:hypothetical protein
MCRSNKNKGEIKMPDCIICGHGPGFRWTDNHGIGACVRCGAPYRLYHYEKDEETGESKRVEKDPECLIAKYYIPFAREYWEAHHRNCMPGAFNFPGSSYEVATRKDFECYKKWNDENEGRIKEAEAQCKTG